MSTTGLRNQSIAKLLISNALLTGLACLGVWVMAAVFAFALFAVGLVVAIGVMVLTIAPYRGRIACLLVHGTQSRVGALPALPVRGATRAIPRLTASPTHLRAVA